MAQNFDYSAPDVNNQYQQDISQINDNLVALMTAHSGNTQPSGLSSGALWLDTSNVPYTLKQLDSNGNWVDQALLTDRGRDVDNARGTRDTLDKRISESLNDDGSLKTNVSANISQFIDFAESGTNAVDTDTFEVDGDHVTQFYPNSEKGRIAKIEQPNDPTTYGAVDTANYDSGTNTTTVNLISSTVTNTLKSGIGIDDIHYGTVDSSDKGGLPLVPEDKALFTDQQLSTNDVVTFSGINLADDNKINFGNSNDFSLRYDSADNRLFMRDDDNGVDLIKFQKSNGNIQFLDDGAILDARALVFKDRASTGEKWGTGESLSTGNYVVDYTNNGDVIRGIIPTNSADSLLDLELPNGDLILEDRGGKSPNQRIWDSIDKNGNYIDLNDAGGNVEISGLLNTINGITTDGNINLNGNSITTGGTDGDGVEWQIFEGGSAGELFLREGNSGQGNIELTSTTMEMNFMPTEAVVFTDAGSTSATEQDWIEVTVGGTTGYIRVFASK